MDKTKRDNRIKTLGKFKFYLWTVEDKVWKILNKIFRANYYNPTHKPKWLPSKVYYSIRRIYEIRVMEPYYKMTLQETKEDFSYSQKLKKFEKYLN